jgi:hypothetical protein
MKNTTFPSYKCGTSELKVLAAKITARIANGSRSASVPAISGHYEASPCFYTIDLLNEDATDENAALWIETGTVIPLLDIVGQHFWQSLNDQERVAVGPCLLKMIEQNQLKATFSDDDSGKASNTAGSKKIVRKAK